jgi:sugar/nucleoside kinase (ribokinase family)
VYDAVLVSNYCKGFITMGDVRDICAYHNNVYLDSNKCEIHVDLPLNLRYLKINEQELEINPFLKHHLKPDAGHQSDYTRPAQIIVTRGYKGCDYMGKTYPPPRRVVAQDLAGAGDTFLAALAVATTRGESPDVAINFANDCSTTVVAKRGVRTV